MKKIVLTLGFVFLFFGMAKAQEVRVNWEGKIYALSQGFAQKTYEEIKAQFPKAPFWEGQMYFMKGKLVVVFGKQFGMYICLPDGNWGNLPAPREEKGQDTPVSKSHDEPKASKPTQIAPKSAQPAPSEKPAINVEDLPFEVFMTLSEVSKTFADGLGEGISLTVRLNEQIKVLPDCWKISASWREESKNFFAIITPDPEWEVFSHIRGYRGNMQGDSRLLLDVKAEGKMPARKLIRGVAFKSISEDQILAFFRGTRSFYMVNNGQEQFIKVDQLLAQFQKPILVLKSEAPETFFIFLSGQWVEMESGREMKVETSIPRWNIKRQIRFLPAPTPQPKK